jgi:hypothetical protein
MSQTDSELRQQTSELEELQIELSDSVSMKDDELEGIISSLIESATDYIDLQEAPDRVQAHDYYQGKPFGNEEDGRSQVVSMDVRDTIALMLPQIMRTFFGSERVVEFMPRQPEDVLSAQQATDYVNQVVLAQDNPAFSICYNAIKDSLVKRVGVIRVDWERREQVSYEEFTGLDDQGLEAVLSESDKEATSVESYPDPSFVPPPQEVLEQMALQEQQAQGFSPDGPSMVEQAMEAPMLHDVVVRQTKIDGNVTLDALPPEEFLIDRRARSVEDSAIVAHRRYLSVSELVQMGYDYEEMLELAGDDDEFGTNTEYLARHPISNYADSENSGESNRKVLYIESYAKVDYDNDGISELRRFCTAGNHHKLLHHSPVNELPFIIFNGYPEPHVWKGQSVADLLMDVQRIKSMVMRNMLDSLAKSIHPDTEVVEGQVNTDDVLSNKVGKIVRTRAPGMIRELNKDFSGREAFPMMQYLDTIKEDRTGMSKASMGLNPDALQSSTKAAVSATVAASQAQIELLCRIYAETGVKPLFKKILKLLHSHQDRERMVRLRNEWVPIDPRHWDVGMDVSVNVALGLGTQEERMVMLEGIAAKQENILEKLGPDNPLVNYQQYHATLTKMTELSGFRDSQSFWTDPATYQAPEPPPPEPSPDEIFAQAQADKVRADMENDKARLELEREKMMRQDDLDRDKLETDLEIKVKDMENKYKTTVDSTEMRGMIEKDREKIRVDAQMKQMQMQQMMQPPPQGMPQGAPQNVPPMQPEDMNPEQIEGEPITPIPS